MLEPCPELLCEFLDSPVVILEPEIKILFFTADMLLSILSKHLFTSTKAIKDANLTEIIKAKLPIKTPTKDEA